MTLRLAHFALCAGILTSPAIGQEGAAPAPETGGAFIGRLFRSLTPHAPEAPTADFVRRSRPQGMNYVPFTPTVERTGA
ncbi:MAG: hypothetical protein N2444_02970, partial [Methylocystis sp.]|nr:hypothetical protein [Methylocystis sp.]